MGQPVMAFLEDEFKVTRNWAALVFGGIAAALGFFCMWLYPGGAFDEFDFWMGTFALFVFALDRNASLRMGVRHDEGLGGDHARRRHEGAGLFSVPSSGTSRRSCSLFIFVAALVKPTGAWGQAAISLTSGHGWPFAPDSVIGKLCSRRRHLRMVPMRRGGDARARHRSDATSADDRPRRVHGSDMARLASPEGESR